MPLADLREILSQRGFRRRPAVVLFAFFDPLLAVVALPAGHCVFTRPDVQAMRPRSDRERGVMSGHHQRHVSHVFPQKRGCEMDGIKRSQLRRHGLGGALEHDSVHLDQFERASQCQNAPRRLARSASSSFARSRRRSSVRRLSVMTSALATPRRIRDHSVNASGCPSARRSRTDASTYAIIGDSGALPTTGERCRA